MLRCGTPRDSYVAKESKVRLPKNWSLWGGRELRETREELGSSGRSGGRHWRKKRGNPNRARDTSKTRIGMRRVSPVRREVTPSIKSGEDRLAAPQDKRKHIIVKHSQELVAARDAPGETRRTACAFVRRSRLEKDGILPQAGGNKRKRNAEGGGGGQKEGR